MRNVLCLKLAYGRRQLIVSGLALVVRGPARVELRSAARNGALRTAAVEPVFADIVGYKLLIIAQNVLVVFFICRLVLLVLFVISGFLLVVGSLLLVVFGLAVGERFFVIAERVKLLFEGGVVVSHLADGTEAIRYPGKAGHERGKQQHDGKNDRDRSPLIFGYHAITLERSE